MRKGYKIIFSDRISIRNGVGVIIDEKMNSKVVDVIRKSDCTSLVKENKWSMERRE